MEKDRKVGAWVPFWVKIKTQAREIMISRWGWLEAKVKVRRK